jgi:hypothetical protein
VTTTGHDERERDRRNVEELTAYLRSAVWDLAYAGQVEPEQALRLHDAAGLFATTCDRVLRGSVEPPDDVSALLAAVVAFNRLE